jgi:hypothetical protein
MLFGDLNINSAFELLRHPKPNYRNVVNPQVSTFVQFTNYNASCRDLVCRADQDLPGIYWGCGTVVMVSYDNWHKKYFDRLISMRDGKILTEENQENILITEPG